MSLLSFILVYIHYWCIVLEVVAVTAMIAGILILGYDMWTGYRTEDQAQKREEAARAKEHLREMMRKERIRRQKAKAAHEGFFEESYIRGFDANGSLYHLPKIVPTARALEYYKQMDELENTQQFNVVEEIVKDLSNPKDQ